MPAFTAVASSAFTGSENPLSEGSVWTAGTGVSTMKKLTDIAVPTSNASDCGAIYTGSSFNASQYSRAKLTADGTTGGGRGVALHVLYATGANTTYRFIMDHAASNNARIERVVAGVYTTKVDWTQSWSDGDTFTFAVENEVLYVYNGSLTLIQSVSDVGGGVPTTGKPGVGYSSTITSASLDDWEGGNFSTDSTSLWAQSVM